MCKLLHKYTGGRDCLRQGLQVLRVEKEGGGAGGADGAEGGAGGRRHAQVLQFCSEGMRRKCCSFAAREWAPVVKLWLVQQGVDGHFEHHGAKERGCCGASDGVGLACA